MAQTIKQGNIFGRIGSSFGQGLAESVPKGYDQGRLSNSLQQIQNSREPLTPIQQYQSLINGGANSEQIGQILPLLERHNANLDAKRQAEEFEKSRVAPTQSKPVDKNPSVIQPQQEQTPSNQNLNKTVERPKSLITSGPQQAALNIVRPLTNEERKVRGNKLRNDYPNLYKTQAEGEAAAENERNSEINQNLTEQNLGTNQKAIQDEFRKETARRLGLDTQKQGPEQFNAVPGSYIKKALDREEEKIANGEKTTNEAADDASEDIRKYADLRDANKKEGKKWFFSKNSRDVRSLINQQKQGYKERNEMNTFVDDLINNHDLSRAGAEYVAYPIKDNKNLNNWLANVKGQSFIERIADPLDEKKGRELASEVSKYLGDNDSLLAIALEMQGKGIDGGAFLDGVRQLYNDGKIKLNKHNIDELENTGTLSMSLGDLFLFNMGEFGNLKEVK
jgi:hypothetical protein